MNSLNSAQMMTKNCAEGNIRVKRFAPRPAKQPSCEPLIQNYSNFKMSASPDRFMFYDDGSWIDYPNEVCEMMKLGFVEGKPIVETQVLGFNCFFDFYRMLQIDLDSGNQRSISWIDVDGKSFFPKALVNSYGNDRDDDVDYDDDDVENCDDNCTKVQIDIKIGESLGSSEGQELSSGIVNVSKRKRVENGGIEGSSSSSNNNAKKRQVIESESQSARWPKARILGADETGYGIVKNLFMPGLEIVEPGAVITSIHKCVRTGPLDKARSEVFSKQMEITKRARGESNMVFAWYGTSAKGVESILLHGFGIPSETCFPKGHGIGVHLSPIRSPINSAMMSEIDENGEKHVILCRLILGNREKVEAGSKQMYPSSDEYDTGVDDLNCPKWYTVWHANMNTHILPECVVSYRPGSVKPSTNGIPNPSMFIAKLLSKLRSFLPVPQFQELVTSWGSCKEGKLGKDVFMKRLRLVVGDDKLRSTIQEIRG